MQLICAFIFAYVKIRFSHDAAHIVQMDHDKLKILIVTFMFVYTCIS